MRKNYTFLKTLLSITCGFIAGILSAAAQSYTKAPMASVIQWGTVWIVGAYFIARLGREAWLSALLGALFLILSVFGYFWTLDLLGGYVSGAMTEFDWKVFSRWALTAAVAGGGLGLLSTFGGVKSAAGCVAQSLIPSVFLAIALFCLFNLAQYIDRIGFVGLMLLIAAVLHAGVYRRYAGTARSMLATLALAVIWLILRGAYFLMRVLC